MGKIVPVQITGHAFLKTADDGTHRCQNEGCLASLVVNSDGTAGQFSGPVQCPAQAAQEIMVSERVARSWIDLEEETGEDLELFMERSDDGAPAPQSVRSDGEELH